jgi:hypothetical protein
VQGSLGWSWNAVYLKQLNKGCPSDSGLSSPEFAAAVRSLLVVVAVGEQSISFPFPIFVLFSR